MTTTTNNPQSIYSKEFIDEFEAEKKERMKIYPDIETYLRIVHGIADIMSYEPDYSNVDTVITDKVRGNTQLMKGSVMTKKKADDLIDKAIKMKF